jgi:protein-S-isoprenylcysteine O-methyltransferase Ste14
MQIDHDPREPSHKALKLIAILTAVIVLALAVPVMFGVRWAVDLLPPDLIPPLATLIMGACGGFFIGRWDALRQRTPGND